MIQYSEEEMRRQLWAFVAECGSQAEASRRIGVDPRHLGNVLRGEQRVGPKIARYFGLAVIRMFVPFFFTTPDGGAEGGDEFRLAAVEDTPTAPVT